MIGREAELLATVLNVALTPREEIVETEHLLNAFE
jgi:hypothetical protein